MLSSDPCTGDPAKDANGCFNGPPSFGLDPVLFRRNALIAGLAILGVLVGRSVIREVPCIGGPFCDWCGAVTHSAVCCRSNVDVGHGRKQVNVHQLVQDEDECYIGRASNVTWSRHEMCKWQILQTVCVEHGRWWGWWGCCILDARSVDISVAGGGWHSMSSHTSTSSRKSTSTPVPQ